MRSHGDRGLLSLDNVDELRKVMLPNGHALEFILAVPGRRYDEFVQILKDFQSKACDAKEEIVDETRWNELRLVIARNPEQAQEQTKLRRERIAAIVAKANQWVGKLDGQDAGEVGRGRKLSDSGAKARLYHEVRGAHLARITKVDLNTDLFSYTIDEAAQAQAELMDGKLLLVTNVPDHTPVEVVKRYNSLVDIERGFRVLKSEIEIAPVHHRLPQRIRAHSMLCFIALIVYRVMRQRHSVSINAAAPIAGISTVNELQSKVFAALKTKKPTQETQMNLPL
jgi:transposase